MARLLFFLCMFFLSLQGRGQVQGIVRDEGSGLPLQGVRVSCAGSDSAVYTDREGRFLLPCSDSVLISAGGYIPGRFPLSDNPFSILLAPVPFSLQEIQVSTSSLQRRILDQPSAVSVLQADDIERNSQEPSLILNQVPGVFMHAGTLTTSRLTIRGIGARNPYGTNRVRVYMDEVPLTSGSGETMMEDIDWSFVERAEIFKGPAPGIYGSGLGGTLVLHSSVPGSKPSSFSTATRLGEWNLWQQQLKVGWNAGESSFHLHMSHLQESGYRENNATRKEHLALRQRHLTRKGLQLESYISALFLQAQIPSSIDSLQFSKDPASAASGWLKTKGREEHARMFAGFSIKKETKQAGFTLGISLNASGGKEVRPFDLLQEQSVGLVLRTGLSRHLLDNRLELIAGAELSPEVYRYQLHENVNGEGQEGALFSNNREGMIHSSVYLQGSYRITERIRSTAGFSLNSSSFLYKDLFHTDTADLSGRYTKGFIPAPRMAVEYFMNPANIIFVCLSKGFALPSLSETLSETGIINPSIRPETCLNLEVGMRGEVLQNQLRYNFSLYNMLIRDMLVAERIANDSWVGRNAGRAINRGTELELSWSLIRRRSSGLEGGEQLVLSAAASLNETRFTQYIKEGIDYSGNRLAGVPFWNASSSVEYRKGIFFLAGSWLFTGAQYLRDDESKKLEPWSVGSLSSGMQFHFKKNWNLTLTAFLMNPANSSYAPMIIVNAPIPPGKLPRYYYPGEPRHVQCEFRIARIL